MARGKYRDASIEYRNALKRAPESLEAHGKLAEAATRAQDIGAAWVEYVRIADLDRQNPAAQIRAASVYLLAGRCSDARDRAQAAVDLATADPGGFIVLGEALGCLSDRTQSVAALKEAVRLAPGSAEARVALAGAYWSDDRPSDAEAELNRAVAAAPSSALANRALAMLLMATGREAAAEARWKIVAAAGGAGRLAVADYYIATNRLADADREARRLLAAGPADEETTLRLAVVAFARGNPAAAFAALDAIVAHDPRSVTTRIVRAQLLAASGKIADALADARATAAAHPKSADAHLLEGDLLVALGRDEDAVKGFEAAAKLQGADPTPYVRIANLHLTRGRPHDAVEALDHARHAAGNTPTIAVVLIDALTRGGDLDRAEQEARAAIAAWPRLPVFPASLGRIALATSRLDEARRAFEAVVRLAPNATEGIGGLAAIDLRERRPRDAQKRIAIALRTQPRDAALLLLSAQTRVALGDHRTAEATLKQLIADDPTNLDAFAALGSLYVREGRLAQARDQFIRAAERAPSAAPSTMVGMILEAEGQRDRAKAQYEQALARFPRAAIAANNLAWLDLDEGRLDDALRWATVAHEEMPRRAEVADTLGWVHLRRGDVLLALRWLADAADLRPDNPIYHYHLGAAYARSNQRTVAAKELARAIGSTTAFPGRQDALDLLRELQHDVDSTSTSQSNR